MTSVQEYWQDINFEVMIVLLNNIHSLTKRRRIKMPWRVLLSLFLSIYLLLSFFPVHPLHNIIFLTFFLSVILIIYLKDKLKNKKVFIIDRSKRISLPSEDIIFCSVHNSSTDMSPLTQTKSGNENELNLSEM